MTGLRRGFKTWCENAAASYRRDLGLRPTDPLDPKQLAAHLGVLVWSPAEIPGIAKSVVTHLTAKDPEAWDAVTIHAEGSTLIIFNDAVDVGRRNNSLAHELSHVILEHEPAHVFHTPDGHMMMNEYNKLHEEEANCLAATLLLPRVALLEVVGQRLPERAAAGRFGVSLPLFQMRRNMTGVDRQLSYSRAK